MKVIDLSQALSAEMPVYPGTESPIIRPATTIAEHGFAEKVLTLYSHTGTHIDAPAHILPGAATLDELPPGHFFGRAACLDLRGLGKAAIESGDLAQHRSAIEGCDFVLLNTGWSGLWGRPEYFENYPTLTEGAAEWLAQFGLKGLGVDAISLDPIDTTTFPVHKIIFGRGMISIENLTRLDELPQGVWYLSVLPLKIVQADGSPVRAAAIIP